MKRILEALSGDMEALPILERLRGGEPYKIIAEFLDRSETIGVEGYGEAGGGKLKACDQA